MLKGVDHVAIAVRALDDALPFYTETLGFDLKATEKAEEGRVRVAILTKGPHRIELIESVTEDSPIRRFLEKRGPGLHHLCLEVDDLDAMLDTMRAAGTRLIDETARPGADGRRVAFVHPEAAGGVLLELSEKIAPGPESA